MLVLLLSLLASGCQTTGTAQPFPETERQNSIALKKRGEDHLKSGKYRLAIATYQAALSLDDQDSESRYGLAEGYLRSGATDESIQHYQKIVDTKDYRELALQGIGLAEFKKTNLDAAQASLTLATAGNEYLWRSWNGLAQIYDQQSKWKLSEEAYERALEYTKDKDVIYNNMGVSFMAQERFKEAEKSFRDALRYNPKLEIAKTNNKLALAMQNKYDEATIESNQAKKAKDLNNAGYAAMLKGDYKTAEKLFIQAIEVSPSFYKSAYQNLQVLNQLKKKG